MIRYSIINPSTPSGEETLEKCMKILESHAIYELPETFGGTKSMVFCDSTTKIYLQGDGVRRGYLILCEKVDGQVCHYKSAKFKY